MAILSPNFLDELRSRTPIASVIGRTVRLTRSGRESKGCCPFHGEKTPSFYVYEDHFHCFGCGEHGDVITFVMKSTGAGFMEVVEQLAGEAGLELPKASPHVAEVESKRASIIEVLEAAASVYQKWLFQPEGSAALSYLRNRGLSEETIKKFGIGWSGEGRGSLARVLSRQGITTDQLILAGLMKSGDFGPVDYFFGRVMFPIFDRRGKVISFGGRIIGEGNPKYVNGPETSVFSKGRTLYGLNFARETVRKPGVGNSVILVEGYMDVVALAQAGFGAAVAPLGTALTEHQLAELWKLSPMPFLCFDSDKAGRAAALRAVELAYGHLAPDRSLKMISLPDGQDPDSYLRAKGKAAFETAITAANPLAVVLFNLLSQSADLKSAEGRASFRKSLISAASKIADRELSSEVRKALLDQYFAPTSISRPVKARMHRPAVRASDADDARCRILTSIVVAYPRQLPFFEEQMVHFIRPTPYDDVIDSIDQFIEKTPHADRSAIHSYLASIGLTDIYEEILSYLPSVLHDGAPVSEIAAAWDELFRLMPAPREALRKQKDDLKAIYLRTETREDWEKYKRMCQFVWRAEHAMDADDV